MAIFAIPETKPSACRLTCPSLYTIIQCLCTLTICSVLMTCMTSTLWVENFVVSESSAPYRLLSVGLFKVCYYTDIERPGTATDCTDVKFKDFTLSVQICQCISAASSCIAVILCFVRIINKIFSVGAGKSCDEDKLAYETRKFRIVCYLIIILGLAVSVPLYICEANLGGVELIHQMTKRLQDAGLGTTTVINNSTQAFSNSINNSTEGPSSNSTAAHPRIVDVYTMVTKDDSDIETVATTAIPHLPHYSVFAIALWMQFLVLGITLLTFTMALIKHARKRKERQSQQRHSKLRRSSTRPGLTIELAPRPRSESQMAFFSRQTSQCTLNPNDGPPMSP